ncbi:RNA-directed DNA polymerase, eukaryota, reverse transcriptase zinc-binding domain protein [Tanacetum coccineum]
MGMVNMIPEIPDPLPSLYTLALEDEENYISKRLNRVLEICGEDNVRYSCDQVPIQFVNHFQKFLGGQKDKVCFDLDDDLFINKINSQDVIKMIEGFTNDEVKTAMFDIDDNKAPGQDGFTTKFYKKSWHVIGEDVCNAVKELFVKGKLLRELNATLITLVPKITDNILLTQEILKDYDCAKGPKRCSVKIDIQKAYDTVDWKFLENALRLFGGRGIRQDDLMSPYLFTLVMEVFNLIIQQKISEDNSFKYHFGCKRLKITHLYFANDLLVLCHGKSIISCGSMDRVAIEDVFNILPFKRVKARINDWKNYSLSYAGRTQLIACVLASIQVYWVSVFKLPKMVINDIERLFKGFLWNKGDLQRGKAMVSWKEVCQDEIIRHMQFKIGNGCKVSMWHDSWSMLPTLDTIMAVKGKLVTQDKLAKLYLGKVWKCPLCMKTEDSHHHLFFECEFSRAAWEKLHNMANEKNMKDLDSSMNRLANLPCKNSVWSIVRRFCVADIVYHLCVRSRLLTLKVKNINGVKDVEDKWGIHMMKKSVV